MKCKVKSIERIEYSMIQALILTEDSASVFQIRFAFTPENSDLIANIKEGAEFELIIKEPTNAI